MACSRNSAIHHEQHAVAMPASSIRHAARRHRSEHASAVYLLETSFVACEITRPKQIPRRQGWAWIDEQSRLVALREEVMKAQQR
jgi:hypothetical protein